MGVGDGVNADDVGLADGAEGFGDDFVEMIFADFDAVGAANAFDAHFFVGARGGSLGFEGGIGFLNEAGSGPFADGDGEVFFFLGGGGGRAGGADARVGGVSGGDDDDGLAGWAIDRTSCHCGVRLELLFAVGAGEHDFHKASLDLWV